MTKRHHPVAILVACMCLRSFAFVYEWWNLTFLCNLLVPTLIIRTILAFAPEALELWLSLFSCLPDRAALTNTSAIRLATGPSISIRTWNTTEWGIPPARESA